MHAMRVSVWLSSAHHATLYGLLDYKTTSWAVADTYTDADGICADLDTCTTTHDPQQVDTDGDRIGDRCDVCPEVVDPEQGDEDADGIGDSCDPSIACH